MKRIFPVMLILFLAAGLAHAKDLVMTKSVDGMDLEVRIDRNPPVVGENKVTVTLKDASGAAVTDARVRVDYSMAAMPGMPPMSYKSNAVLKGSSYTAPMNLSMSGPWNIAVKIARGGKTSTAKFNVDAH